MSLKNVLLDDLTELNPELENEERDELLRELLVSAGVLTLNLKKEEKPPEEYLPGIQKAESLEEYIIDRDEEDEGEWPTKCPEAAQADALSIESFESSLGPEPFNDTRDALLGMTIARDDVMVLEEETAIFRKDHYSMTGKVKLLSGGRAGLDPLFAGYVGVGMLTAVILGDDSDVPTVPSVLNVIRQLSYNHKHGVLVFVLNYLEDRLNFGTAVERARSEGMKVETVVVADDCWNGVDGRIGRRGLAGAALIFKVAGAMSEHGLPMKDIYAMSRALACRNTVTISASLTSKGMLLGTGLDGSHVRGHLLPPTATLQDLVANMMVYALDPRSYFSLCVDPASEAVVMVNSYTDDKRLLYSATHAVIAELYGRGVPVARVYAANFVSGPKRGLSVTLMREYGQDALKWLDKSTSVDVWPKAWGEGRGHVFSGAPLPSVSDSGLEVGPMLEGWEAERIALVVRAACRTVVGSKEDLDLLDVNGCYGSRLCRAARAVLLAGSGGTLYTGRPFRTLTRIAEITEEHGGAFTGALFSCIFTGAAQGLLPYYQTNETTYDMWYDALRSGVSTLKTYTKLRVGDGTLLDALVPALQAMDASLDDGQRSMGKVVEAAEAGANRTKLLSSPKKFEERMDPGAAAVYLILKAIDYGVEATRGHAPRTDRREDDE